MGLQCTCPWDTPQLHMQLVGRYLVACDAQLISLARDVERRQRGNSACTAGWSLTLRVSRRSMRDPMRSAQHAPSRS